MPILRLKPYSIWTGIILSIFIIALVSSCTTVAKATEQKEQIEIVYFYDNPCASCDEEGKFIELFNSSVGIEKEDVEIKLNMHNIFHASGRNLLQQYFKEYKVPKEKQVTPILFINNVFLAGDRAINERLGDVFSQVKQETTADVDNQTTILHFYVTACRECEEVSNILNSLEDGYSIELEDKLVYSHVVLKEFNIGESENLELVKKYFGVYKVPEKEQSVPIIFIGDTYLSGRQAIQQELVNKIKRGDGINTLDLSTEAHTDTHSSVDLSGYGIAGVVIAGLVNGVNPCSLSMLLFFLSLLVAQNKNILKMGLSFCLAKFITYFILGTLLFNIFAKLQITWFSIIIKVIMLIVIFIIITMNILDYLTAKHEKYDKIRLQLPVRLRKYNHEWIKKLSSIENTRLLVIVSFVLGVIISIGEFLCTGQIYLATIIYVLKSSPTLDLQALFYFLLYGLAFITPLILVTYLIHKGKEIFDVSDVLREKMPVIKLVNAALFFIFGIVILIWF
jgi:glutaredoxin